MNKIFTMIIMSMVLAMSAVATDMTLDPQWTHIDYTEDVPVEVCVMKSSGGAYDGLTLSVTKVCQDKDGDEACDDGTIDVLMSNNPGDMFYVEVTQPVTDLEGCGEVTLHTSSADAAVYVYQVNGKTAGGVLVDDEYGGAYIPEFTAIGAGLALLGAGLVASKKRKKE